MFLLPRFVWNISPNVSIARVCLKHITQCLYCKGLSETYHPMSLLQGFVWNISPNVSTARVCLKHITQRLYCKGLSETYHPMSLLTGFAWNISPNVSIARVCLYWYGLSETYDVSTSRVCLQHMTERTPNVPASRACPNYMINLTMQNDAHGFPTFPYFGPSFRIHSHKNGGTAQFYHLLKQNWKLSFCHSTTAVRTNSNTQFLLHSYPCFDGVHFTLCVCVRACVHACACVCVCVCICHPSQQLGYSWNSRQV